MAWTQNMATGRVNAVKMHDNYNTLTPYNYAYVLLNVSYWT